MSDSHNHEETALHLENVSFSDGDISIIKQVSGVIPKGKITTFVGPSGAGKTTLFRLCNGLISPDKGEIRLFGESISTLEPTTVRRNVGLALQQATMLSGTVMKNLALPKTLKGESLDELTALSLLEQVGLDKGLLHRNVADLSGGQKQKISIARTLVNEPSILLLDEITSSLDRISKRDIEQLIKKLNQENGVTIAWITHNIEQALSIGDYSWVMMNGSLLESGDSKLLENPKSPAVREFVKGELS
ncbi:MULTISPECIES: phosphate ABC transporter ATP-binding protein [Oceanobacillus]|uniref:ABC transporter ATP-binding protein YjkB n=1 Tax=Oceanobacillus kimchii TaxID=746691 RepID=A0ABQ5TDI1_9BACI|nr:MULTISPECIES: phosphate ABC transporter ATP-binding protein [Oceanobacillus]MBT2652960.1 phosphate ABC transporter ATP-binding protein [Oceanobacillus sp. ISL-73]MCT1577509.1 phosphate ABC transporter ATP-binding protein [Oceanobacillus kimchii]MCT2137117.1 phosphate ABC transporter ATP-binding protein [Oceanobacillus kimchii]OEH53694.1 amino acid ABC transporter ATP-binding protein [Oceanobacillus sp. E9]GLO64779.1 putative ABC transporter ATP-binding protein YjkB [Oceanobacillus kimchii]